MPHFIQTMATALSLNPIWMVPIWMAHLDGAAHLDGVRLDSQER